MFHTVSPFKLRIDEYSQVLGNRFNWNLLTTQKIATYWREMLVMLLHFRGFILNTHFYTIRKSSLNHAREVHNHQSIHNSLYRAISSAKSFMLLCCIILWSSSTYNKNNKGPSTDPCRSDKQVFRKAAINYKSLKSVS